MGSPDSAASAMRAGLPAVRSSYFATILASFLPMAWSVPLSKETRHMRAASSFGRGWDPSDLPFSVSSTSAQLL